LERAPKLLFEPALQGQQVPSFHGLVGNEPAMRHLVELLKRVAPSNAGVLILGESGTGKEVVAQALHAASPRADKPFLSINCGALPPNIIESELFGHEKDAFTGAGARRRGAFEAAHGGTLFLDEVGELPLELQARLLRVLDSGLPAQRAAGGGGHLGMEAAGIEPATPNSWRECFFCGSSKPSGASLRRVATSFHPRFI
jgi:transcriptional regulator with GAF, ATPase, and Fis domain